ncbi:ABC transporter ATP-binding protein [Lysobacter sp. SG-8]|uniref:ABC transporter ATP-binding protein n=1 Tax=Marilutibacter penaei TaxID=2759900 RepID=A0A7W3U3I8_9GAMM|nr:ATP-binding cassette domain-containing protein [Lysobacter penaei]MBB1087955.1 ABC transporter ATP-binding protein [Lysobacter penaei]
MSAYIKAKGICLDVPAFLQREREASGWLGLFMGAAFDPPKRRLMRLLSDIDFELHEGDRLAILGRNGAGKSTLLRVLNNVYQPTSGTLEVNGSCQALLNMSLGFSGEATVRENIYLRGIAMGLKAAFLRHQVDPILEFSGLREKATHRLRTLSSGQKMRLGFAISTSVQNDIMLMDEWVGAGDAEFMAKAKDRMQDRVGGAKILVLASHSVGLLRNICNRGILLEQGRIIYEGDITSALKNYHELLAELRARNVVPEVAEEAAGGAQVYGCAETIRLEDGLFVVKGWILNSEGAVPGGVVVEVDGRRYIADRVEHHSRRDVAAHFGLADDRCGFHAYLDIPGAESVRDLGDSIQVFGGDAPERADAPLRVAPGFTTQLVNARRNRTKAKQH